jgi:hypothetical protein
MSASVVRPLRLAHAELVPAPTGSKQRALRVRWRQDPARACGFGDTLEASTLMAVLWK